MFSYGELSHGQMSYGQKSAHGTFLIKPVTEERQSLYTAEHVLIYDPSFDLFHIIYILYIYIYRYMF